MKALPLRCLPLFILLLVFGRCYSQDKLYVVNGYELGYVDMGDYSYKKMANLPATFADLAITPDGKFYAVFGGSLYEVNPATGNSSTVTLNPSFGVGNSLVSDRNGDLFVAGNGNMLYKINLKTLTSSFIGNMIAYPGGDLCFSDGKLYMVTSGNSLVEITLTADRNRIASQRLVGPLNVRGSVFSIGTNQYGICYLISTAKELALIDLEDATTYVISNSIRGSMRDVWGIAMEGEGGNDKDIEVCGNGIDDDHNGRTDGEDMACRLRRGTCDSDSKEIFREDFGTGTGFGPPLPGLGNGAYQFSTTAPLQDGYYSVVNNPQLAQGGPTWKQMTDHSGKPDGRMMVVNGSFLPGEFYRKKITGLCGGLQYALSVSACSVISPLVSCGTNTTPVPSRIRFRIEDENGQILGQLSERYIPADPDPKGKWKEYGMIFTLPENVQNIQIVLLNDAPGGCGNDLAVDDILLSTCKPVLPVKINGNNSPAATCLGSTVTFAADQTGITLNNPVFSWQKLDETDGQWKDIPNARGEVFILSNFTADDAGQFRVQLKENNAGACIKEAVSAAAVLRLKDPPAVTAVATIKVCNGEPLKMQASTAATPATVDWQAPDGNSYNGLNAQITGTATAHHTGSYVLTAKFSDGCTATATTQVTVQERSSFDFTVPDATVCVGLPVKVQASGASAITAYQWAAPNGTIIDNNTAAPAITFNTGGKQTITLKADGYCISKETVSHEVSIQNEKIIDFVLAAEVCMGKPLHIRADNNGQIDTYSWDTDNGAITGGGTAFPEITWNQAGVQTVTLRASGYCIAAQPVSHTINVLAATDPGKISFSDGVCPGEPLEIEVKNYTGNAILWQIAGQPDIQGTQNKLSVIWNRPGAYPVKYAIDGACGIVEVTAPKPAIVRALPTVTLGRDTLICRGVQFMLHPRYSSDAIAFSWQDGPFTATTALPVSTSGNYKVTVKNEWGCKAAADIRITEKYCGCDIYLPTAFSPNGDGKNDILRPVVYCVTKRFLFQVYNRWGQLVFSTANPREGWNGVLPGRGTAEIGSYLWTIEYESFEFPDVIRKTGTVTVIK
ncbi:gliding motility-associated C-terminal domain-containing protein [Chitinophaga eiseniae]|uniref:Gliding motility-associated C-terminal domain-containing protein n=1 Tax=Chitinophaga eiseniae TaxID=634771 RepID=A0A1T4L1X5_9BACT|nr:gliding motility-associated C-terminal domain-containing protein [Chitinophaga eiseniae]SJZ48598.1 gliding motility-associated C-terminal domain-containing protein [Chitinophaga eiseniae]